MNSSGGWGPIPNPFDGDCSPVAPGGCLVDCFNLVVDTVGGAAGDAAGAVGGGLGEIVPPGVEVEGWWSPSGRCRSGIVRSHLNYT